MLRIIFPFFPSTREKRGVDEITLKEKINGVGLLLGSSVGVNYNQKISSLSSSKQYNIIYIARNIIQVLLSLWDPTSTFYTITYIDKRDVTITQQFISNNSDYVNMTERNFYNTRDVPTNKQCGICRISCKDKSFSITKDMCRHWSIKIYIELCKVIDEKISS